MKREQWIAALIAACMVDIIATQFPLTYLQEKAEELWERASTNDMIPPMDFEGNADGTIPDPATLVARVIEEWTPEIDLSLT
jgi:hypothetical protein